MKSPLVSVIIPAFNHEKYINETIFSIINQTYNNIELLIIDDGSNDITYDKICELERICKKRFVRFDFKTQPNTGIIATLNNLLEMTSGEYIYLIASDDMAAPHAIETGLFFLQDNKEYSLCVGNNDIIDENTNRCFWDNKQNNIYNVKNAEYTSFSDFLMQTFPKIDFFSDNFGSYFNLVYYGNHVPNGYLIRRSIFKNIGCFVLEAPLEDYWLMMQIAKHSKIKYLEDTLYFYRWHGRNTILNISGRQLEYKTLLFEMKTAYPEIEEFKIFIKESEKKIARTDDKIRYLVNIFCKYYQKE